MFGMTERLQESDVASATFQDSGSGVYPVVEMPLIVAIERGKRGAIVPLEPVHAPTRNPADLANPGSNTERAMATAPAPAGDFLIRGANVITQDPNIEGGLVDVLITNGKIEAVGGDLTSAEAHVIDAA